MIQTLFLLIVSLVLSLPIAATEVAQPGSAVVQEFGSTWDISTNGEKVDGSACGRMQVVISLDDTSGGDTSFAGTIEQGSGRSGTFATALTISDGAQELPAGRQVFRVNPDTPPAAGSRAVVIFKCQEQFSSSGGAAPGLAGDKATMETLQWIWGLERVPFPQAIDTGQWTDYYFSSDAGGDWGIGDNAQDGLTPATAKLTIDEAKTICFGGPYRRCNFDQGDDWTVANGGWVNGFGLIQDADITNTGCPDTLLAAMAQPCFWLRSSPGGRALFDATNTLSGLVCFELDPTAKRTHLLVEAIDITCDSTAASAAPWDTDGTGILTVVAGNGISTDVFGSGNIASAHDVSITHVYGDVSMSYAGTATGTNPVIATQYAATVVVHTAGLLQTSISTGTSNVVSLGQSGGTIDASLEAEAEATPAYALITGAHMQVQSTSTSVSPVISFVPSVGTGRSNMVKGVFISNYLDHQSTNTGAQQISASISGGGSVGGLADITFLYPTFSHMPFGVPRRIEVPNGALDSTSTMHIRIAGGIFESSADAGDDRLVRIVDTDWLDGSGSSTFTMLDTVYAQIGSAQWNISSITGGGCVDTSPTDLASCSNGIRSGSMVESNNLSALADTTGGASSGGAATLVDLGIGWTVDEWEKAIVRITSGAGSGQTRRVVSNTADTLTVTPAWTTAPTTNNYSITRFIESDGYCNVTQDASCEDTVAGSASAYSVVWSERAACPAFICGRRVVGFTGTPAVNNDPGRVPGSPWSAVTTSLTPPAGAGGALPAALAFDL